MQVQRRLPICRSANPIRYERHVENGVFEKKAHWPGQGPPSYLDLPLGSSVYIYINVYFGPKSLHWKTSSVMYARSHMYCLGSAAEAAGTVSSRASHDVRSFRAKKRMWGLDPLVLLLHTIVFLSMPHTHAHTRRLRKKTAWTAAGDDSSSAPPGTSRCTKNAVPANMNEAVLFGTRSALPLGRERKQRGYPPSPQSSFFESLKPFSPRSLAPQ